MSQEDGHGGFMRQDVCAHSHIFRGLLPQINEQIGVWCGVGHVMIDLCQKPALVRVHFPAQDGNLPLIHWVLERHDVLGVQRVRVSLDW